MEPASNPNPIPFEPRVKRSHWTVIIVVLTLLVVVGGWFVTQKIKQTIGWFRNTKQEVVQGNYSESRFNSSFFRAYDPEIKTAKLVLNGGEGIYLLHNSTGNLFDADAVLFHSRYILTGLKNGSSYGMYLSRKSKAKTNVSKASDTLDIRLNTAPVWDISVNTGASELNFDLSKYKVRNFKISGSAGAFVIKTGMPVKETKISLMIGAGDITISIPKTAACHITQRSTVSKAVFPGFDKKKDGSFETPGYSSAANKISISLMSGASDFKVNQY